MLARVRQTLKLRSRLRRLIRLLTRPTSISDTRSYTHLCARAASDARAFSTFKRQPAYTAILEHVSCELGREYLETALARSPKLEAQLEAVRRNDLHGSPRTCNYGQYGVFSPTTLRYLKVLSDLEVLFGDLTRRSVVEIGVGYGGQCYVASTFGFERWTLIDLPPVLRLARRYLETLGVEHIAFAEPGAVMSADLLISNYAFSECTRDVQEMYLDTVLSRCLTGYMTCNFMDGMGRGELVNRLPGSRWLAEVPLSGKGNAILVWGDERATGT
jgi:putative sugar O-methyltransferase